jgi:signal transduction histidine kinase
MKIFYKTLWNRLEKASTVETDSPSMKRRKITLVVIATLCSLLGIIAGIHSSAISSPFVSIIGPFSFATIVGMAILIFFLTNKISFLLYPFLITILFIPAFLQMSVGGFTGDPGAVTIIFWSSLAPIGALMFLDLRKALWWFCAYLILVFLCLHFDEHFIRYIVPTTHDRFMIDHGISIFGLSVTVFLTMFYFVNAFQKEHARAEKLVVDLTDTNGELEKILRELKETQSELVQSEKMASLGKLAAGIAHEINNPIGALKSTANNSGRCLTKIEQSLEKNQEFNKLKEDADLKKFIKILRDNIQLFSTASERVASTVNNFVKFARLDGAEFDKVSINDCINNTIEIMKQEVRSDNDIKKEYDDIPKIACYPGELNQVFLNILTNSAQAIKGQGSITIRTSADDKNLTVKITDTGIGIHPEKLQSLFDPDFTKDSFRIKVGLGLFTCYNIVKKHNGSIIAESELGKGSTFTITIPVDLDKKSA